MTVLNAQAQRLISAVVSVVLATLLTGCEGNSAGPVPSPESSTPNSPGTATATSSTSPTGPTPPSMPVAAKGLTASSADAFARYFFEVLYYLQSTGDATLMQRWSDKGCIGCGELMKAYDAKAGSTFQGDFKPKPGMTKSVRLNQTKAAEVVLDATVGAHQWRPHSGASPTPFTGGISRWDLTLQARNGQWILYEVDQT
jgi:hypothetical protein